MEKKEIRDKVNGAINLWILEKKAEGLKVEFSPNAKEFIYLIVENIAQDPSLIWKVKVDELEGLQSTAISKLLPALDKLAENLMGETNYNQNNPKSLKISSWEVWHSLSDVLENFCFIDKHEGSKITEEKRNVLA